MLDGWGVCWLRRNNRGRPVAMVVWLVITVGGRSSVRGWSSTVRGRVTSGESNCRQAQDGNLG